MSGAVETPIPPSEPTDARAAPVVVGEGLKRRYGEGPTAVDALRGV